MICRRDVFQQMAAAALWRTSSMLTVAPLLSRADAQVTPEMASFRPEIEPIVALIERTPRDHCAAVIVEQLRAGVSYRQLMAALFLAGIRNINPRPPGLRLLPLFYALDNFKTAQERDARGSSGDYAMRPFRGPLLKADRADAQLSAAMDRWDVEQAERAVVSVARLRGPAEVFEILWRYGARDYRNIGHKAIFVANAFRTLHTIGWQHAEPVLRSLVVSLLDFGKEQQLNGYRFDDQCYAGNLKRLRETFPRLDEAWVSQGADTSATRSMLDVIRQATPDEACADAAARLGKRRACAGAIWDAVHLSAAELRMRLGSAGAIVGIHAVTAANALGYAYLATPSPQTRFLVTMQAIGWMVQFRRWAETRGDELRKYSITNMEPFARDEPLDQSLAEIFGGIPTDLDGSAARVCRLAQNPQGRRAFLAAGLQSTIAKANEVHYYKYIAALIEDSALVNNEWQPHLLAAIVYYLKGANDPDSAPMEHAREALRALSV